MSFQIVYWIAGSILALAWFSRIVEAAIGMPRIADVARPEWDRKPPTPTGEPRVSIIVPACNEERDIRATLDGLLALEYSNYEIIAVNDRSTDATGARMEEVAAGPTAHEQVEHYPYCGLAFRLDGQNACHVEGCRSGDRGLAALHRC